MNMGMIGIKGDMSKHHHSPEKYTRRTHVSSGPWSSPTVSHVRRHRRRPKGYIFQGDLMKIKPPTLNGDSKEGIKGRGLAIGNEEMFPIAQLSLHGRKKNFNLPLARKGSHVVGSS
jgi:hypothetical protein